MNRPDKPQQLSLRDQLALHAPTMPADYYLARLPLRDAEREARWRYEFADAMLKQRQLSPQG